jgi:beta-galactosidase
MVYLAAGPANARGGRLEEHWNWPEGSTVAVSAFTNAEEVTLRLNGQELGTQSLKAATDGVLHWDVPYRPGVLTAVARSSGRQVAEFSLTTAGAAARIELIPDRAQVTADANGVWQVEFRVVDAHGVRVPGTSSEITFEAQGPIKVLGIGNADLNDPTPGQTLVHRAYQGRGLAILQSTGTPGAFSLRASAPGLAPAIATGNAR